MPIAYQRHILKEILEEYNITMLEFDEKYGDLAREHKRVAKNKFREVKNPYRCKFNQDI